MSPERLENIVLLDSDAGFARATKGETRVYESPGDMLIANVSQEFCKVMCQYTQYSDAWATYLCGPMRQVFCCVFKPPCTSLDDTPAVERDRDPRSPVATTPTAQPRPRAELAYG